MKLSQSLRGVAKAIQPQSSLQGDETFPPSLRGSEATEAIHKDKSQKADSSSKVDCHDLPCKSRNDKLLDSSDNALSPSLRDTASAVAWQSISAKVDSRFVPQAAQPAHHDSRNCGGAVGALRFLGKVSELGVRAFHKNRNTAALPTQSRIA